MTMLDVLAMRAYGPRVPEPAEAPWTLAALGSPRFAVVVAGSPAPQGSKKLVRQRGTGRTIMLDDSKATAPWRADVVQASTWALQGAPGWVALDGPLVADFVLTLPRPQDAARGVRAMACKKPDLDKLARSTGDALTDAGVIHDDARIVAFRRLEKVYARDTADVDSLRHPGAVIRVWQVPGR